MNDMTSGSVAGVEAHAGGAHDELTEAWLITRLPWIRTIPWTWASERLARFTLATHGLSADEVAAALRMLRELKARQLTEQTGVALELAQQTICLRVEGLGLVGAIRPHFNEGTSTIALLDTDGAVRGVRVHGDTLSATTHLHVYTETAAWGPRKVGTQVRLGPMPGSASLFNLALEGNRGALAELGLPSIRTFEAPAAYLRENWRIDGSHHTIEAVLPCWKPLNADRRDPLEYLLSAFKRGRLPFATENDVRLFLMALASPLLRYIHQGLLGVYWFTGGSGHGKDFAANLAIAFWRAVVREGFPVDFSLSVTNELEVKRSLYAGAKSIYARAHEAGKRKGLTELIIKLGGGTSAAARGMRRDEAEIPLTFTILADSAESIPNRREMSRRTVAIPVMPLKDKDLAPAELYSEIEANAASLMLGLLHAIESRPLQWFREQRELGFRPIAQVALARLFGADLPVVEGADLAPIWEGFSEYIGTAVAAEEAERQRRTSRDRDGKEARRLPHYRFSHVCGTMKRDDGCREFFSLTGKELVEMIRRELGAEYLAVERGEKPYLRISVGDQEFAFRPVKGGRAFVFLPEHQFVTLMELSRGALGA